MGNVLINGRTACHKGSFYTISRSENAGSCSSVCSDTLLIDSDEQTIQPIGRVGILDVPVPIQERITVQERSKANTAGAKHLRRPEAVPSMNSCMNEKRLKDREAQCHHLRHRPVLHCRQPGFCPVQRSAGIPWQRLDTRRGWVIVQEPAGATASGSAPEESLRSAS